MSTARASGHKRQKQSPTYNLLCLSVEKTSHLGEGGQKTTYAYNIAAIRMLKTIEAENRGATAEEQEILSRYVGWGGIPQAFDEDNENWGNEYIELKELLTKDE